MRPALEDAVERYTRAVIRWKIPVVLLATALVFIIASGGRFLSLSNNYRVFFGAENPQLQAFESLERIYTKNDNILFVLHPASGDVFTPEVLEAVAWLTEQAWQIPYSLRVDSITNFQHSHSQDDDLTVEDLMSDPAALDAPGLEAVRAIALAEPVLAHRLVSPTSTTTGINVTLQYPGESLDEVPAAVGEARRLAGELRERHPEIRVALTGVSMLNNAFAEAPIMDMQLLVPLMYGVLVLAMILFLRSVNGTISTVVVIAFSAMAAMGTAGWVGMQLDPISVTAITIILTVGIADSVHILVPFFNALRRGASRDDALVETMRINFEPVTLTSLTTAIGFLSLNFSDSPPYHTLGNITAFGVGFAWLLSLGIIPALVSLIPLRVKARPDTSKRSGSRLMERLGDFVVSRRRRLLIWMSLGAIGLALFIPRIVIDDRPVDYFGPRIEFRRDTDFATEHLLGPYSISFSLDSGESGGISDPAYLRTVEAFTDWLRARPEVQHVGTFTDVMKRLNRNLHGDDPTEHRLPGERELAAQYLLLYEMSLPYGLDMNNQINVDKSATRMDVALANISFEELKTLKAAAESWLEENAPPSMHAEGTGTGVMFAYIAERNIKSMVKGTAVGFGLISLVLVVALRSIKIGLLSLVPNILPAIMAFGIWGLTFREVGFAISIVGATSIGIIVDDTVHFLSKYLRARREHGKSPEDAVRYAFSTVGMALWGTSTILVAGFLILLFSSFWLNASLGILTAITITAALVTDFLLLPALLMTLDPETRHAADR